MTSPRLAEREARWASTSLFPGVKDTRRPARKSTFWAESAPSPQKSPKISQIRISCGWIGWQAHLYDQVSSFIVIIYYHIAPGRVKGSVQQRGW
jgi:hypothetical protein